MHDGCTNSPRDSIHKELTKCSPLLSSYLSPNGCLDLTLSRCAHFYHPPRLSLLDLTFIFMRAVTFVMTRQRFTWASHGHNMRRVHLRKYLHTFGIYQRYFRHADFLARTFARFWPGFDFFFFFQRLSLTRLMFAWCGLVLPGRKWTRNLLMPVCM